MPLQILLCLYMVQYCQSEAHYEHQNPIEHCVQDVKHMTSTTIDRTSCPAKFWLLCLLYIVALLNVLVNSKGAIPLAAVTGQVVDVSPFLSYHFWQEVFYEEPGKKPEKLGRWCGVADGKGDALTYWVLSSDSEKLVARSNIRPARDPLFPNRRARPDDPLTDGGEVSSKPVLFALSDLNPSAHGLPTFSPDELIGRTYLHETENGELIRAKVTRKILDRDAANHQRIKFLINVGDDAYEEIIAYNELSDIIERQVEAEMHGELDTWTFQEILAHEGPLSPHSPRYNGSSYNVRVRWSDGSETWEPLNMIGKDNPVTLAAYAKDNDLLEEPAW